MKREIKQIISQIKKHEISINDIPEEYKDDFEIIKAERKLGLRKKIKCGYEVILDSFFVEEEIADEFEETETKQFKEFVDFYNYLEGEIYNQACYYQLSPDRIPNSEIDLQRLFERKSFISKTIDNYVLLPTLEEKEEYKKREKRKVNIKKWISRFNECITIDELYQVLNQFQRSTFCKIVDEDFFLWNYIFNTKNEMRFEVIMDYVSSNPHLSYRIRSALCSIFDPDTVIKNYNPKNGSYNTNRKRIKEMEQLSERRKKEVFEYTRQGYFDDKTHFYCVETNGYDKTVHWHWPVVTYYEYYENIEDFVYKLKGDLRYCDLSKTQNIDYDFSSCIVDESTSLPVCETEKYNYYLTKKYFDGTFYVKQVWQNKNGIVVKEKKHSFEHFCDFIYFLKGDLSGADLISCDGLHNLISTEGIDLSKAILTSSISNKWHLPIIEYCINIPTGAMFDMTKSNEIETAMVLRDTRELDTNNTGLMNIYTDWDSSSQKIFYISDLHLYHFLKNKNVITKTDIIKIIRDVVKTIIDESGKNGIVLINGDTSLDYIIFKLFVSELKQYQRTVVFTIGNHDIWSCPDVTMDLIEKKYRSFLRENDMYLVQNDILYFDEFYDKPKIISEEEIKNYSNKELRTLVRTARLIIFGGTGFSGYNPDFNAESGIYRYNKTIGYNREIEMKETQRIEALYHKIRSAFHDKNVVIMTHMPLTDWYYPASLYKNVHHIHQSNVEFDDIAKYDIYEKGFVYLSGHTHRNYYYDDGDIRIYADNQFGYNENNPSAWPHLKFFEVEKSIDFFADYKDGIYEITADEYKLFYQCKNIMMDFNRKTNIIYMLKKNGYYCFIHKNKLKLLSIMNGGALKRLDNKDINYYYDKMDLVINLIKNPLNKYTEYQNSISKEIKKLGGKGRIHGCIIDIDFFNHIYINPNNGKVMAYSAANTINKLVYPTILSLLEAQCPNLFTKYQKLLEENVKNNYPIISSKKKTLRIKPIPYLDTNMYVASRQMKKMQKLSSNILSTWPDRLPQPKMIESTNT